MLQPDLPTVDDGPAVSDRHQDLRLLEAILFAAAEPLSLEELASRMPEGTEVAVLLDELAQLYANRGVKLLRIGTRWAFRTAPDLAPRMRIDAKVTRKLSRAAIETLAIIAYHQPATRAEIEEIRGVGMSKGTLDILLEAGWIRPKGRRQTPGRPVMWCTTEAFLDHFSLESLDALPGVEELKAAGLIDSRPAITILGARQEGDAQLGGAASSDEEEGEESDPLSADFGEELVPVEDVDGVSSTPPDEAAALSDAEGKH